MTKDELLGGLGRSVLDALKSEAGSAWDAFPKEGKSALTIAAADLARYTLLRAAGEGVEMELVAVRSTIANWTWVGADLAREHLKTALEGVLIGALRVVLKGAAV